jgi:hypothetical protein
MTLPAKAVALRVSISTIVFRRLVIESSCCPFSLINATQGPIRKLFKTFERANLEAAFLSQICEGCERFLRRRWGEQCRFETLKLCLLILIDRIFDSKIDEGMPSSAARNLSEYVTLA